MVRQCLEQAVARFETADPTTAERLRRLTEQVDQTCRVAVVGRMSAGKSSFINALLGQDKAPVGVNETTATINHFIYGKPRDPRRPIRCCWTNGQVEDCDEAFLTRLQGKDVETLRLASAIARLEYLLENPFLSETIVVDTPEPRRWSISIRMCRRSTWDS
jgi:ATPase subunit of ABC transporter with duplicated ATPase domains